MQTSSTRRLSLKHPNTKEIIMIELLLIIVLVLILL